MTFNFSLLLSAVLSLARGDWEAKKVKTFQSRLSGEWKYTPANICSTSMIFAFFRHFSDFSPLSALSFPSDMNSFRESRTMLKTIAPFANFKQLDQICWLAKKSRPLSLPLFQFSSEFVAGDTEGNFYDARTLDEVSLRSTFGFLIFASHDSLIRTQIP